MTNYPYTYEPDKIENFKDGKKYEVLGLQDSNDKNTLSFDCKLYEPHCPLKRPKVSNTVKVYVSSIKYTYQQDLLFRFKDYFFDKFLDSLADTDPYYDYSLNQTNIEEKLIKFKNEREVRTFDLNQPDETIEIHCEIKNPLIIFKARNHYKDEFKIFLGNITVDSSLVTKIKKWRLYQNKPIKFTLYTINVENTTFFHKDDQLGSIKTFTVEFENILYSEIIEFIDPLALDKSLMISLDFCPIDVKMSKEQFTYFMKCIDLNINYDDGFRDYYDFRAKKEFAESHPFEEDYKFMIIESKMTSVSLS